MKIFYYMPFKPLNHPQPSGDLMIGRGIFDHLKQNQQIELASSLRLRHLPSRPTLWLRLLAELIRLLGKKKVDLWLTYHSYYKAPDLLGALYCRVTKTPYIIFQGIYSSKRRKKYRTKLGFYLNRFALRQANLVITNKKNDQKNLQRLLAKDKIIYLAPGIKPQLFTRDQEAKESLRKSWQISSQTKVILSTAMFRPGAKSKSLYYLIDAFSQLLVKEQNCKLVILGDGEMRAEIAAYAQKKGGESILLLGKIKREKLAAYYSAADIFAFPGIEESLGMVYLEAQSCGLPVVACREWGASEAVIDQHTGFLTPHGEQELFTAALQKLIHDPRLCLKLGKNAQEYIRQHHDQEKNYQALSHILQATL